MHGAAHPVNIAKRPPLMQHSSNSDQLEQNSARCQTKLAKYFVCTCWELSDRQLSLERYSSTFYKVSSAKLALL